MTRPVGSRGAPAGGAAEAAAETTGRDPVMAADVNVHNQVSLPDFMDHLARQFFAHRRAWPARQARHSEILPPA